MELDKNKQYLVFNYSPNVVTISTRHEGFILQPGSKEEPTSIPLSLEEIMVINNSSVVFKYGLLWFEPEYEEAIYEHLRIRNWRDILTDEQIRDILLNPTTEGLQKLLDITNDTYFSRVRGVYVRLKNIDDVPSRVANLVNVRYREILNKKMNTSIEIENPAVSAAKTKTNEVESLKEELSQLKAMMAQLISNKSDTENLTEEKPLEKPKAVKAKTSKTNEVK